MHIIIQSILSSQPLQLVTQREKTRASLISSSRPPQKKIRNSIKKSVFEKIPANNKDTANKQTTAQMRT